jgi:thermostable 8-oxoguanine DNA glycosylase
MSEKVEIQLYLFDWGKVRDEIVSKVHNRISEIKNFVEKNFDLKKEVVKNAVAFAYLKSAIIHRDLITQGIYTLPHSDIRNALENYGYSFILSQPHYPQIFLEFCDEFRYKNNGEIFEKFLNLIVEKQSEIRDALTDTKITYIC